MTGLRRASIDIGSNSVRTLAIEWAASGVVMIHDQGDMARIGDSIQTGGELCGEALQRAMHAVAEGARVARRLGAHLSCFATAGVRDLRNRDSAILRLGLAAGSPVALVSGKQEALLSYAGVMASLPAPVHGQPVVVADVGGGSTELAWGRGHLEGALSVPVGARKLLAEMPALGGEEPLSPGVLGDAVDWARHRLASVAERIAAIPRAARTVGVGGSMTTLAAVHIGMERYDPMHVHGSRLNRPALAALGQRLASLSKEERGREIGEPGRADLILPGWAIITAVLESLDADSLEANVFGPRLGILTEEGSRVVAACRRGVA